MKILFYNHTGQVSGAERVMLMILDGIDRRRFEPMLLTPYGRLAAMARDAEVQVLKVDPLAARFTLNPISLIKYLISFRRIVRSVRATVIDQAPDVVHANSIRAGLVMSAATIGLRMPVIWHVHDLLPRHLLSTAIRLLALLSGRNHIIAVSHAVAERFRGQLLRWFSARVPLVTIHNAVDLERFVENSESSAETRRSLGINDKQILIGAVGQLTPRKGQMELIAAFAKVAHEIPNVVLMFAGEAVFGHDSEYAAALIRAASESGVADRIRFLGAREDVPALMRAFDFLVVNSRAEPFGLIVTEAMASGTAVLATAVDGIPEIVTHAESGWLLRDLSQISLVDGMLTLLNDPALRRRLGRLGRRVALEHFSSQRFLNETQALYRRVAGPVVTHELPRDFHTELTVD